VAVSRLVKEDRDGKGKNKIDTPCSLGHCVGVGDDRFGNLAQRQSDQRLDSVGAFYRSHDILGVAVAARSQQIT
jgi:hypothetical protein